ncbi:MAG: LytTR family DNA-binding domain-containing protein [Bacteroidota bacterium]
MKSLKIRICIVEDEQKYVDDIKLLLAQFDHDFEIVEVFDSLEGAINGIPNLSIDLLFLDVELRPGYGFDLLERLSPNEIDFKVIFVTAFEKYAVKAFKFSAFDFLLKPLRANDLAEAIKKYIESHWGRGENIAKVDFLRAVEIQNRKWESLKAKMNRLEAGKQPFPIPVKDGFELVMVDEIVHCEARVNQANIYLKDQQPFKCVNYTLKELEARLSPYGFLRIHQSHLVNMQYVKKWNRRERLLTLRDSTFLPVSQMNVGKVVDHLKKFSC